MALDRDTLNKRLGSFAEQSWLNKDSMFDRTDDTRQSSQRMSPEAGSISNLARILMLASRLVQLDPSQETDVLFIFPCVVLRYRCPSYDCDRGNSSAMSIVSSKFHASPIFSGFDNAFSERLLHRTPS